MTYKNPNLIGNLEPLQKSIASVESMMNKLDRIVTGATRQSSSRYIRTPLSKQAKTLLEQIAPSLLRGVFSNMIGNGDGGQLSTDSSSRSSQGQMLADMASAISRASTRYL